MTDFEKKLKQYRLSKAEYDRAENLLGRAPQGVEWALFSALWSEHCSYKSSKVHLKGLFNQSPRVLQSMGENAGVLDLGQGERIAFKMESHNHPSFIEPYQGAATGVGGILRDVFTMGARPIALANYLCFGEPQAPRMKGLVDGVVRGIAGYGNAVGVPNVTGQTEFHSSYNQNILVNAFALGLFRPGEKIALSKAKGPGNWVVYVGAKTGRDGVHGASMASESFDQDSESKRPTVQIGDPFFEKLLIESCLEVIQKELVVAIQDMGAAGLTSSSFEMAAKGGVGFDIDLSKVPLRDSTLTPEDILLSESQERMLLVCEPKNFKAIEAVFHHWNLDANVIGEVTPGPNVRLLWKGDLLTEMDPRILVDDAPVYNRDFGAWKPQHQMSCEGDLKSQAPQQPLDLLKKVQGGSRQWIFRQYDQRVGARTVRDCGSAVGVVRLPDSGRGLGIVLGCRPHVMRTDARLGGIDSVAFPALGLAAKGFETLGVTDCLNFGNPEKIEIMTQFVASVRGMSQQCAELKAPIISGNVSFYNETEGRNITSTPATGLVGLRSSVESIPSDQFQNEGEEVFLVRCVQATLTGLASEGEGAGFSGDLDPAKIARFSAALMDYVNREKPIATRVSGKLGLGYCLMRMSLGDFGFIGDSELANSPRDLWLEHLYEVVISLKKGSRQEDLKKFFSGQDGVEVHHLGRTTAGRIELANVKMDLAELKKSYTEGWRKHFEIS